MLFNKDLLDRIKLLESDEYTIESTRDGEWAILKNGIIVASQFESREEAEENLESIKKQTMQEALFTRHDNLETDEQITTYLKEYIKFCYDRLFNQELDAESYRNGFKRVCDTLNYYIKSFKPMNLEINKFFEDTAKILPPKNAVSVLNRIIYKYMRCNNQVFNDAIDEFEKGN